MASGVAGTAGQRTGPDQARRAWPRWLAGGVALLVLAVVAVFWTDGGARLLLGVAGAALCARGAQQATGPVGRSRAPAAALVLA
ncbi:MAG: hypothetical protein M3Q47_16595, partial [Actinomycetota bacterium]|nr:hypothetical protein [Actinomycetota bacterium]